MSEFQRVQLARQEEAIAIANLLNQHLQSIGITARTALSDDDLNLVLESEQAPNQPEMIVLVSEKLANFKPQSVSKITVYGQQHGKEVPDWQQTLALESNLDSIPQIADAGDAPSAQRPFQRSQFLASLKTFRLSSVIPYKEAVKPELYNSGIVRLLLFFSLFPWAMRFIIADAGLERTAWILGIYYASIWGIVLRSLIKPRQFSWGNTLKCVAFTAFIGIPILLIVQQIPFFKLLYMASDQSSLLLQLFGFIFGVGILEEVCKALPVYLLLLRPGKLSDPLTAAFYGAMSGLGFAIAEGASYSMLYAFALVQREVDLGDYVLLNTLRFISTPLFHAIWAGISGYFLGLAAINPSRQQPIMMIGIAIAATLHGLYNTFAGQIFALPILIFSILLFVAYLNRSKQMVEEMAQAELEYKSSVQSDLVGEKP